MSKLKKKHVANSSVLWISGDKDVIVCILVFAAYLRLYLASLLVF